MLACILHIQRKLLFSVTFEFIKKKQKTVFFLGGGESGPTILMHSYSDETPVF